MPVEENNIVDDDNIDKKDEKKFVYAQKSSDYKEITDAAVRTPYVALLDVNNNKIIDICKGIDKDRYNKLFENVCKAKIGLDSVSTNYKNNDYEDDDYEDKVLDALIIKNRKG